MTKPQQKEEKVRAELNIEKWPAIWNPTHSKIHSKGQAQSRTLERESTGPDGTKIVSKVTINPIAQLGDLTTDDQRTLYALIKHWEERGKPEHETPFSIRHVARLLHKKGWGSNVIDAITGSLERLRGTMLVWNRSYRTKDQRIEDLETVYINIVSKLKIVRRKVDGHVTTEAGYFQFDDHILRNLLSNYTKPLLFDVFMDIKGEIALKLYAYVDLIMADKNHFERCTKDLFADLGLQGSSYRSPSKRKQNLENAVAELTGMMLTTGVLKSVTIEKTKDGKDYKAVFQKGPRTAIELSNSEPATKFASPEPVKINDYSKVKNPLIEEAEAAVRFFHKLVHGVREHHAQSKELGQALSLITQHGSRNTQLIIEYAKQKASETNFKIQHFGAVISYASRALAEGNNQQTKNPAPATTTPTSAPAPDAPRLERGERRLTILSPEQYQFRFQKARADLFREQPFLSRARQEGSSLIDRSVRSRMVRELETEILDLVCFDADLLTAYPWLSGPAQNLPL